MPVGGEARGDQRIKRAHQQAGDEREHDTARGGGLGVGLALAVSGGVEEDGHGNQGNSAEEEQGIGRGADEVTGNRADDQRQADADGEGDSEAGHIDGGDQQQVGDVEDDTAEQRR